MKFIASVATGMAFVCVIGAANAAPVTFTASGADAAAIQSTVDDYRAALGALNGNLPENLDPDGRRQINWDGVPDSFSDPNAFPGDFFNGDTPGRARGIEFRPASFEEAFEFAAQGFQVSSTQASGQPVRFGQPDNFTAFSEERIFAPIDGTIFDVFFFDPLDQTTRALTRGLGVVFTDVEESGTGLGDPDTFAGLAFLDAEDNILETVFAPVSPNGGLSFAGIVFDDPVVSRVQIVSGLNAINSGFTEGGGFDSIAMDDFIFGEPIAAPAAVPLPAGVWLLATAVLGGGVIGRQRRRIG